MGHETADNLFVEVRFLFFNSSLNRVFMEKHE